MLDILHDNERIAEVRKIMQKFYAPLKACDADLHFVFITGITKFSQLSIFIAINNLTNVSMQPEYSAICGITEDEQAGIGSLGPNCRERLYGSLYG